MTVGLNFELSYHDPKGPSYNNHMLGISYTMNRYSGLGVYVGSMYTLDPQDNVSCTSNVPIQQ